MEPRSCRNIDWHTFINGLDYLLYQPIVNGLKNKSGLYYNLNGGNENNGDIIHHAFCATEERGKIIRKHSILMQSHCYYGQYFFTFDDLNGIKATDAEKKNRIIALKNALTYYQSNLAPGATSLSVPPTQYHSTNSNKRIKPNNEQENDELRTETGKRKRPKYNIDWPKFIDNLNDLLKQPIAYGFFMNRNKSGPLCPLDGNEEYGKLIYDAFKSKPRDEILKRCSMSIYSSERKYFFYFNEPDITDMRKTEHVEQLKTALEAYEAKINKVGKNDFDWIEFFKLLKPTDIHGKFHIIGNNNIQFQYRSLHPSLQRAINKSRLGDSVSFSKIDNKNEYFLYIANHLSFQEVIKQLLRTCVHSQSRGFTYKKLRNEKKDIWDHMFNFAEILPNWDRLANTLNPEPILQHIIQPTTLGSTNLYVPPSSHDSNSSAQFNPHLWTENQNLSQAENIDNTSEYERMFNFIRTGQNPHHIDGYIENNLFFNPSDHGEVHGSSDLNIANNTTFESTSTSSVPNNFNQFSGNTQPENTEEYNQLWDALYKNL